MVPIHPPIAKQVDEAVLREVLEFRSRFLLSSEF
jgi:hypothetical protein